MDSSVVDGLLLATRQVVSATRKYSLEVIDAMVVQFDPECSCSPTITILLRSQILSSVKPKRRGGDASLLTSVWQGSIGMRRVNELIDQLVFQHRFGQEPR